MWRAGAIAKAEAAGIPHFTLPHKEFPDRISYDRHLAAAVRDAGRPVVLAGFMRLLTGAFLGAFENRVVNIHPALLPAFPGVRAQTQAAEYGVCFSGCTVHFVDEGTDTGPIIAQAVVPAFPGEPAETLQKRILAQEHQLYPKAIQALAAGRVKREGRHVTVNALSPVTENWSTHSL